MYPPLPMRRVEREIMIYRALKAVVNNPSQHTIDWAKAALNRFESDVLEHEIDRYIERAGLSAASKWNRS